MKLFARFMQLQWETYFRAKDVYYKACDRCTAHCPRSSKVWETQLGTTLAP